VLKYYKEDLKYFKTVQYSSKLTSRVILVKTTGNRMPVDDGIKLFVYGISASCPRDLLEDKFGKCGRVNDVFNTGKGYAFITMDDERGAEDAIDELHGSTIDGQEVKVELSKPRTGGRGGGDRDRGYGGGRDRRGGGGGYDRRGGGDRDRGYGGGRDRDGGRSRFIHNWMTYKKLALVIDTVPDHISLLEIV